MLEHFFSNSVEIAQKKVENRNYSIRRQVVEYDNVMNKQREEVYRERNKMLNGESVYEKILEMIGESVEEVLREYLDFEKIEEVNIEDFNRALEVRILSPNTNLIFQRSLI